MRSMMVGCDVLVCSKEWSQNERSDFAASPDVT